MVRRWWERADLALGTMIVVTVISITGNTRWNAPPRFDGAGYAVLARALAEGRGYREIAHPDAPPHAHFPPGYPLVMAGLRRMDIRSVPAIHLFSNVCTLGATLAAWCWFRLLYPARVAFFLGLALAINWTWGRTGGMIQSEPLYLLLSQCAILFACWNGQQHTDTGRLSTIARASALGGLLASCVLTRHVGLCSAVAILLDLLIRRRLLSALTAGAVGLVLITPWIVWLRTVRHNTQAGLLVHDVVGGRVARQALFYVQRLPDSWVGPFVETGTVFRDSLALSAALNVWAAIVCTVLIFGWVRALRTSRRRLASLVVATTFPLLLVWPFTEAGRFLIPLVPCVLIGLVEGLAPGLRWLSVRRARLWAAGLVLATSIPYATYAVATRRVTARERAFADFDAACAWLGAHREPAGPVLSRHPGEVYWLSGRPGLMAEGNTAEDVERTIQRYGIAYLLIDEERYAKAPSNPLARFVATHPKRVRRVWSAATGSSSVTIEQVLPD